LNINLTWSRWVSDVCYEIDHAIYWGKSNVKDILNDFCPCIWKWSVSIEVLIALRFPLTIICLGRYNKIAIGIGWYLLNCWWTRWDLKPWKHWVYWVFWIFSLMEWLPWSCIYQALWRLVIVLRFENAKNVQQGVCLYIDRDHSPAGKI
jgi:hypothetical protein